MSESARIAASSRSTPEARAISIANDFKIDGEYRSITFTFAKAVILGVLAKDLAPIDEEHRSFGVPQDDKFAEPYAERYSFVMTNSRCPRASAQVSRPFAVRVMISINSS